jgi:hypothetical protein
VTKREIIFMLTWNEFLIASGGKDPGRWEIREHPSEVEGGG